MLVVVVLWVVGVASTADLKVPRTPLRDFKTVLAIFPHADDETVNCGGTIRRLASTGALVTLLLLTSGERGNRAGISDSSLKEVRRREAERASAILGVTTLIQEDFGDGELSANRAEVGVYVEETIRSLEPDLILTYDPSGLDGHPDHIVCAEIVIDAVHRHAPASTLWCSTLPRRVVRLLEFARQLPAGTTRIDPRRMPPTARVFLGMAVIAKIRAWYAYRTQRGFIAKGLGRFAPVWFAVSSMQFEYFARID